LQEWRKIKMKNFGCLFCFLGYHESYIETMMKLDEVSLNALFNCCEKHFEIFLKIRSAIRESS
jgi:hypothetical protein